ncbi:PucR family transcriptional regulator [Actinomadura fibrosa]|uniref:PucR family transcriptional regulator n=1 Tax=Actinomadura fibrosa TaxID=111802 RepID=A0ABW2XJR8_9ACTN|nr:PucR family transcriptional regulator [Actinomadura fibrosa]
MHNGLIGELSETDMAEVLELLRGEVPETVREAVSDIEAQLPQYARLQDPAHADFLARTVERSITGFFEILVDRDAPVDGILAFFREVGAIETAENLSEEVSQAAFRLGAAVSIRRLTEAAERHPRVTVHIIGQVAAAVLDYLNRIAAAVSEGHTDAGARATGDLRARRARLLDALIAPEPRPGLLKELADEAGWALPQTIAAVALRRPNRAPWPAAALPQEVLTGLHLDEPCLVVPDPEGPGRRRQIESGLRGWTAAIGPAVEITGLARSLRLARQALGLAAQGVLPAGRPIAVTDHLPLLILMRDRYLMEVTVKRALAPLIEAGDRPGHVRRLAETFLVALECDFNATAVATGLSVHAQTVRYRMRQLEALFGDDLHDPSRRLEFHMALRAWIATAPPA